jgi:hypothetical protein
VPFSQILRAVAGNVDLAIPFDHYSKSHTKPNVEELRPYYQELIAEFFPEKNSLVRAGSASLAAGRLCYFGSSALPMTVNLPV